MAAITISELNNAQQDVAHIAAVATSPSLTAMDRLGHIKDTLAGAIHKLLTFTDRGAWAPATAYAVKDLVSFSGAWYVAVIAHTSSAAFATDSASKWRLYQGVTLGDLGATDGLNMVGGLNTFLKYPSENPLGYGRNWFDICVPAVSDFIDNVCSVQNKSNNGVIWGNAAFAFLDADGTERGAMGYSRNQAIQPGGYVPNTLYCEIGNPFTTDAQVTHFRVINTIKAGGPFWGGAAKGYFPIEVRSDTGDITLDAAGNGNIYLRNGTTVTADIAIGDIGNVKRLAIAMQHTAARFREYGSVNQFAVTTNAANLDPASIVRDDAARSSWKFEMGGLDVARLSVAPVGQAVWTDLITCTTTGFVLIGQSTTSAGADGKVSITSGGATSPLTLKATATALPSAIFYNSGSTGNNKLLTFGTETSYTERGSITYNRAGGLVSYNTTSDYRAKEVFGDFTNSGEIIDSLNVYRGRMKGATIERPMFIAHEVQAVAGYSVTGEKDAVDADGNPIHQVMDASALVPLLFAEIKSLRKHLSLTNH